MLDLASGAGRHARWLAQQGFRVAAVDRDAAALRTMQGMERIELRTADLEGAAWPLSGCRFDGVVVCNYLYRPRLDEVFGLVAAGGVLIYETFMAGNERFGKPSRPDFLLQPGELLQRLGADWSIVAFEQGEVALPRPAMVQRVCALRASGAVARLPLAVGGC